MRNRWVLGVFVSLVLTFPVLIGAVSSQSLSRFGRELRATSPVVAVELVVALGLVFAVRERFRLAEELKRARSSATWTPNRPSSALAGPKLAFRKAAVRTVRN